MEMTLLKSHVDLLFRDTPTQLEQICTNPVTGGDWVSGADSIALQKRLAIRGLLAREWFRVYGPHGAPTLPLSVDEIDDMKWQDPFNHMVACFSESLRANEYDFNIHPSIEVYISGVLASGYAAPLVKEDEDLRKRFPPRPLKWLGRGLCWEPPDLQVKIMRSFRRGKTRRNNRLAQSLWGPGGTTLL
jgi:hypothetical protein